MNDTIIECGVNFLSYERALELVPPEFKIGFDWYQERERDAFRILPHRDSSLDRPSEITICADRGIHAPNYRNLASHGAGKQRYAIAIHSQFKKAHQPGIYNDKDIVLREDGTWIFDYSGHISNPEKKTVEAGNQELRNNLIDGVPVAVLIQQANGNYINYGLAYVERYNPLTNTFTLHGPVSAEKTNEDFLSILPMDELSKEEKEAFRDADEGDQRKRVRADRIKREKQTEFRQSLLLAYEGSCAATGTDVPEVLQAAHIDPYRGKYSQRVTNGILLRSDIHLLYDSHLLTILPETSRIKTSASLNDTIYEEMDGIKITLPRDPNMHPEDRLLEQHAKEFEIAERRVA